MSKQPESNELSADEAKFLHELLHTPGIGIAAKEVRLVAALLDKLERIASATPSNPT